MLEAPALPIRSHGRQLRRVAQRRPTGTVAQGAFGTRMAALLAGNDAQAVSVQTLCNPRLVVTRLRCDSELPPSPSPIPSEAAFIVCVQLNALPFHQLWRRGILTQTGSYPKLGASVFDLEEDVKLLLPTPFYSLHFYVSRAALDELADECGVRKIDTLLWPHGTVDETLIHLMSAMLPALECHERINSLFVDRILLALTTHFAVSYGKMGAGPRIARGGLAPWQERRCKELIDSRVAGPISLKEMADECNLSSSYFARAFRKTTGASPHRWLMERRVETAKDMLLANELTISEIALSCGFADQSHLTKAFASMVGVPPGGWRRERERIS
jgi:AraC-like DNA-binding protein